MLGCAQRAPTGVPRGAPQLLKALHLAACRPPVRRARQAFATAALRGLHPAQGSSLLDSGHLAVPSSLHTVYYEVHGNPSAPLTALVVHGGPGAGCYPNHLRFFDLSQFKVVLLDQRGCGRSTPRGCLKDNNTAQLVGDIELLRSKLGVSQWLLLGGSWGVALSLAYAQKYPDRVAGLILRGVCTMREAEINWMYGGGAGAVKPWGWHAFLDHLSPEERSEPLKSYYRRLTSRDQAVREAAAKAWMAWEMCVGFNSGGNKQLSVWNGTSWDGFTHPRTDAAALDTPPAWSHLDPSPDHSNSTLNNYPNVVASESAAVHNSSAATRQTAPVQQDVRTWDQVLADGLAFTGDDAMSGNWAQALLEAHYSVHGAFLSPGQLLSDAASARIRHVPIIAVHGLDDMVCPPATAYDLHRALPGAEVRFVPGAGHSMYDPPITHELVCAADTFMRVALKWQRQQQQVVVSAAAV